MGLPFTTPLIRQNLHDTCLVEPATFTGLIPRPCPVPPSNDECEVTPLYEPRGSLQYLMELKGRPVLP